MQPKKIATFVFLDYAHGNERKTCGETVAELKKDFESAVEDYLAYCSEAGIQPRRSYTGTLSIRISPETHSKIAILASRAGISINAFIKQALDKAAVL